MGSNKKFKIAKDITDKEIVLNLLNSINDKIGKANNSSDIEEIKETEKEIKNVLSNINKQI